MSDEATWWVTYADDYPGEDGLMHVYLANADCGHTQMRNALISSHYADGCLIDHQSRIADIEIPASIKVQVAVIHWRDKKLNP